MRSRIRYARKVSEIVDERSFGCVVAKRALCFSVLLYASLCISSTLLVEYLGEYDMPPHMKPKTKSLTLHSQYLQILPLI